MLLLSNIVDAELLLLDAQKAIIWMLLHFLGPFGGGVIDVFVQADKLTLSNLSSKASILNEQ